MDTGNQRSDLPALSWNSMRMPALVLSLAGQRLSTAYWICRRSSMITFTFSLNCARVVVASDWSPDCAVCDAE